MLRCAVCVTRFKLPLSDRDLRSPITETGYKYPEPVFREMLRLVHQRFTPCRDFLSPPSSRHGLPLLHVPPPVRGFPNLVLIASSQLRRLRVSSRALDYDSDDTVIAVAIALSFGVFSLFLGAHTHGSVISNSRVTSPRSPQRVFGGSRLAQGGS